MKKENKQLAQQKRAEARRKQELKDKYYPILKWSLPILAFIIFVAIIIADPFGSEEKDSDDTSSLTSQETDKDNANNEAPTLSTDSSLTVENGDTVNIDYVGSIDGVEFSGGNTQGMGADLTIGSQTYIDDFEEQLIGAHPGDIVNVYVTFPENYGKEDLNGKEALFVVTVNGIYK